MTAPQFHGRRPSFSASRALSRIGDSIEAIRSEDGLTWDDVGRALGKSDDRAAAYAAAVSEMKLTTFLLGCREWNGRFANDVLALIGMRLAPANASSDTCTDREKESALLKAALALSVALADDDLSDEEIRTNRDTLTKAREHIDTLLARIGPKVAA